MGISPSIRTDFNVELTSRISIEVDGSRNVNIGSVTDVQIDALVQDSLTFELRVNNNKEGNTLTAVNVDCQSISYCSKGNGTATIRTQAAGVTENSPWTAYDPDGDTFPNVLIRDEPNVPDASISAARAVVDSAADAAPSSANTLTFSLDVGACLTRNGVSTSGTKFMIDLTAATVAGDESSQQAWFQLP